MIRVATTRSTARLMIAALLILVIAGRTSSSAGVTGAMKIVTPPASINDTCSADVTQSLRTWLYSLPAGAPGNGIEVLFKPGACYEIDGSMYLRNFRYVDFNGNGATFKQRSLESVPPTFETPVAAPYCGSSVYDHADWGDPVPIMWWFEGGCDLTMENMVIDGQQAGNIQGSAIQLNGVQGARLTDLTINNPSGDFVTLSGLHEAPGGGGTYPSTDVLVSGNHFTNAGRQGITTEYVDRVEITSNTIDSVAATVFDMESDVDGGSTYNVRITNNTVGGGYAYLLAALSGATTSWISFDHNRIEQMKVAVATHGSNWTIANNIARQWAGWPDPAITVNYSVDPTNSLSPITNFLVSHNVVPTAPFGKYQVTGREFADSASPASPLTLRGNFLPAYDIGNGHTQVLALSGWGTSCGDTQDQNGTPALNNALQQEPACNTAYSAPTMPTPPWLPGMSGPTPISPPAQTPEVPAALVLPLAAGSIVGVAILLNRRRKRQTISPFS